MWASAEFAYAQARIGARHGERLRENDWKTLDSAQSLPRYLEQARSTALKRFLAEIAADMDPHAIERILRGKAIGYAGEAAAFAPARWRPAIAWLGTLATLPIADGIRRGAAAPGWAFEDRTLTSPASGEDVGAGASEVSDRASLGAGADGLGWLRQWRRLWPSKDSGRTDLVRLLAQAFRVFAASDERERAVANLDHRRELARLLARSFRSHGASPVAVVSHVGLVILDIERLRGGVVRRRLFASDDGKAAA